VGAQARQAAKPEASPPLFEQLSERAVEVQGAALPAAHRRRAPRALRQPRALPRHRAPAPAPAAPTVAPAAAPSKIDRLNETGSDGIVDVHSWNEPWKSWNPRRGLTLPPLILLD
jgi:hypothetical protein